MYDAEVQENINELLQRISNDEVLTDIENMIGEARERINITFINIFAYI